MDLLTPTSVKYKPTNDEHLVSKKYVDDVDKYEQEEIDELKQEVAKLWEAIAALRALHK